MPNRMLRDWTDSEKVNSLSVQGERFFVRLIMKVDDYGCFVADTRLLKANLFPLLLDTVREADLIRWMAECQKAGLVVLYEHSGKKYLQINEFKQRLDKARAKYPLPPDSQMNHKFPESVNGFPAEVETELEQKSNTKGAKALVVADAPTDPAQMELRVKYKSLIEELTGKDTKTVWAGLKDFITGTKPEFIEPFRDTWNIFATNYKLPKVEAISDSRRKKFKTRVGENSFDFFRILEQIKTSAHLRGTNNGNWAVTFDWIIDNDKNYLKIIEGNYN